MKFRFFIAAAILSIATLVTGCGKKTDADIRAEATAANSLVEALEQNRSTALSNVTTNASTYFAANPRFDATWKIMPHTDDYISENCPQGSGWGWVNVMRLDPENPKKVDKHKLYCSTTSSSLGCYIENDFTKMPYFAQSKSCDYKIPSPLKPLGGK